MHMAERFRGYLPVVVDIETGGFNPTEHAILEIALVHVQFADGELVRDAPWAQAVTPYPGGRVEPAALKVTGIDLDDRSRNPLNEAETLRAMFRNVRQRVKAAGCQRAILVAHNAAFDLQFLNQAIARVGNKRSPFHPFSFIDTASLAAVTYGHTVLREACARAGLAFDANQAHAASYDADRTAALFCAVVNAWPYPPVPTPEG